MTYGNGDSKRLAGKEKRRMCWTPHVYVHAIRTSNKDAKQRRSFLHGNKCEQCGVCVDSRTRVAAHVSMYRWPFCLPSTASLTLITTCRKCNSRHRYDPADSAEECCVPRARIWSRKPLGPTPRISTVRRMWCWRYVADEES